MKDEELKEFDLVSLPPECKDPSISKDDFKLVQADAKIHDQKFETKPTTFLKDCLKRFRKNKSSVVAAFILGTLLVMSVVVPIFFRTSDIHDTKSSHPEIYYLEPKLFNAGTGFWDGTKKMTDIAVDKRGSENKEDWGPDYSRYNKNAISDLLVGDEQYIKSPNKYADGGYVQFGYYDAGNIPSNVDYVAFSTQLSTKDIAVAEAVPEIASNDYAVEHITKILSIDVPETIEQHDTLNPKTIAAHIEYEDVDNGGDIKLATVPIETFDLDTSDVKDGVKGTAYLNKGLANEQKLEFTIDVIAKQGTKFRFNEKLEITNFVTFDAERLANSDEMTKTYPDEYSDADSALYLTFMQGIKYYEVEIVPYKKVHDIGGSEEAVNIYEKFVSECEKYSPVLENQVTDIQLQVRVKVDNAHRNACTLIKSIAFSFESTNANAKKKIEGYGFDDGNDAYVRNKGKTGVWTNISNSSYSKETNYLVKGVLCSFTYDTYEAVLGQVDKEIFISELYDLKSHGYLDYQIDTYQDSKGWHIDESTFRCKILNSDKCPLAHEFTVDDIVLDSGSGLPDRVKCTVFRYKMDPYNLEKMPRFLLGTDKSGRDMFIYVFEGLRTSLLLGIITSAVCFLFGLLWGSISGYFGGTVDLAMERFTDILSGVPWIVVMTLTIIHLGSTFFTFALALCLTGWIGTSHITRTQFYRFRGREYVLASRTLGASHGRLIAKHILPNAIGTIITSAVLMVPSIIFSEATISYLGLGFKNLASLGVILSDNQVELTNHPYLLIFPAIIIALLMISFNLFGNGLRDAVNPSLKGEGE